MNRYRYFFKRITSLLMVLAMMMGLMASDLQVYAKVGQMDQKSDASPEIAELKSPVMNGDGTITFNYYKPDATSVKVAGDFTSWQDGAVSMTKNEEGVWSVTQTIKPGKYGYKFIVDTNWVTDEKNPLLMNGNSGLYVNGLVISNSVELVKGTSTDLPTTGQFYTDGVVTEVTIDTYSLKMPATGVSIVDNKIMVEKDYAGTSIDVIAYVGSNQTVIRIKVVDTVYTYNYYYFRSDGDYSDKDLWIWGDGVVGAVKLFDGTFKDEYGREWAKGSLTYSLSTISIIARTSDATHSPFVWNDQESRRSFTMPSGQECSDIWMIYGDTKVYQTMPAQITIPDQRYVTITYLREDGKCADWNVYTWTDSTRVIDFDENGYACIPVEAKTEQLDFVIRKGYPKEGEEWIKDGGDCFVKIPLDQTVVKAIIKSGSTDKAQIIPYNKGYECDVNNHVIKFYYRDDKLFKEGLLESLAKVEVEVSGVKHAMTYSEDNQRYEYCIYNPSMGFYEYSYHVEKNIGEQGTEFLDKYNQNKVNGKSVLEYRDIEATITAMVDGGSISYDENAVLEINIKTKDDTYTINPKEVYVDLSSVGGKSKVMVETELMAISIGVTDATTTGIKQVPITVIDQFGKAHSSTASVNVVNKAVGNDDFDWDESIIYFMLTDRFKDGNQENNDAYGIGDYDIDSKTGGSSYHGGDFAGVTQKLDYLKKLGVNTIWISPIVENITDSQTDEKTKIKSYGYHGYWGSNFEALNKHLGTENELKTLISEAHKLDMKIMVDVVLNHAGYGTKETLTDMFRDQDVEGNTLTGTLNGMPDFATENAAVRNKLIEWQNAWVKGYGIDYFRMDAVKHVESTTWVAFKNALTKTNPEFKLIGEYAGAGISNDFGYLNSGRMDSILNFDFNDMAQSFVTGKLEEVEHQLEVTNDSLNNASTVGNFLGSHDEDGLMTMLQKTKGEKSKDLMKLAATLQMTAKGQPVIYYGEELGQTGLNNYPYQTNRYDLDWTLANDNNAMLTHYKKLLKVRNDYTKVFARGTRKTVAGSNAEGFLVVERAYQDQKAFVAFNLNNEPKNVTISLDAIVSTPIRDVYGAQSYTVGSNNQVTIVIPAVQDGGTAIIPYKKTSSNNNNNGGANQPQNETTTLDSGNWLKVENEIKNKIKSLEGNKDSIVEMTVDMKGTSEIPFGVLQSIQNTNIRIIFNMGDYSWDILGTNISDLKLKEFMEGNSKGINLGVVSITNKNDVDRIDRALNKSNKQRDIKTQSSSISVTAVKYFEIAHNGDFPFEAILNIKLDSKWANQTLFSSYFNEKTLKMEPQMYGKVQNDGTMSIKLTHASKYVLTQENPVLPTLIGKKTLYSGSKYDLQIQITSLLEGDQVIYYSSKKSVATISKSGKIKAKKAGTTIITTRIVQNGKTYLYKTKLTIKKRKKTV